MRKKVNRKALVKKLDHLFSVYIQMRDIRKYDGLCPLCYLRGKQPNYIKVPFHIITRSKYSVRWDVENATGSCPGCNLTYEHDTVFISKVHEWYKSTFGIKTWESLIERANKIAKFDNSELEEIRDNLKSIIETALTITSIKEETIWG